MSYNILIGHARQRKMGEETPGNLSVVVSKKANAAAPSFIGDETTGQSNIRRPGYQQWARFCELTRLTDLFFNTESGLLREHPGFFSLKKGHWLTVVSALTVYQERHPDALPGFCRCSACDSMSSVMDKAGPPHQYRLDGCLVQLYWLEWWMSWALKNCKKPTILNY